MKPFEVSVTENHGATEGVLEKRAYVFEHSTVVFAIHRMERDLIGRSFVVVENIFDDFIAIVGVEAVRRFSADFHESKLHRIS